MINRYEAGKILDIVRMNEPIKGAAITEQINDRTIICSLGEGTDIEAESFHQHHILFVAKGRIVCYALNEMGIQKTWVVNKGCVTLLPVDIPVGVRALEDSVYVRVSVVRDTDILNSVETEKEYVAKDLAPYEEGKIHSVSVVFNEQMQVRIIAMDTGTCLQEHASARYGITVLEGSIDFIYDGETVTVQAEQEIIIDKDRDYEIRAAYGRTCFSIVANGL